MNLRNLYLINMVVTLIFALALLLGPATVLGVYNMRTGSSENLEAQFLGAALILPALISWFAKDLTDMSARQGIGLSLFIFNVVVFVVSLLGTLSGAMRSAGWSAVIIFLLLALGFGYFQFMRPNEM